MHTAPLTVGSAVFDPHRPAIIVPVMATTVDDLAAQGRAATAAGADVVEWRVDSLDALPNHGVVADAAAAVAEATGEVPVLATVRTSHEGAGVDIDESDYQSLVEHLAHTGDVDLIDVELRLSVASATIAACRATGVPVVASYHNFSRTPAAKDLEIRLARMAQLRADLCKVAVTPRSPRDVLELLQASVTHCESSTTPMMAIAMGPLGVVTRLHGGTFGSCATFATVGDASAPGQLSIEVTRSTLDLLALQFD